MQVRHYIELIVYQKARALAAQLFILSRRWPDIERYALTDQIRRASRSVGANLAESWGKRRHEAHFVSKLTDADGESHEVEHWLITAYGDGYLSETEFNSLLAQKREIGRMLGAMIHNPSPFVLK